MLKFDCYSDDKTNLFKREVDITFNLYYPAVDAIYSKHRSISDFGLPQTAKFSC